MGRVRLSNYQVPAREVINQQNAKGDKQMAKEIKETGRFSASSGLRKSRTTKR